MEFSQNNNIFEYSNHKSIRKLKKQLGGLAKKISNPDNDDILLMKIYLKIYIRLFLYIQYKLNKKLMTGNGINNPNRALNKRTLVDAMNLYREDVEMQTYLQSTDLFFIRPLFESMCKDNYNDICIQYFNSFILPKKEFDPESVKELMEKIIGKYTNLIEAYEKISDLSAYQKILNYVRSLEGNITEEQFLELMNMIKLEVNKLKSGKSSEYDKKPSSTNAGSAVKRVDKETENLQKIFERNKQLQETEIQKLQDKLNKLEEDKDKEKESLSKKFSDFETNFKSELSSENQRKFDELRLKIFYLMILFLYLCLLLIY